MSFAFFHRYPFLRLLLSLGVGIYAGDELFFQGWKVTAGYSFLLIFALLGLLLLSYYLKRYAFRWLFGGILFLFFFITGGCWMNLRLQQTVVDFPSEEVVYRVLIAEKPEQKERSLLCQVWASLPGDSTRLTAPK